MANSPESSHYKPIDFRAPPPSPVAAGHQSSVANDDLLTDFLQHSLPVPDLVLPDRLFPRQKSILNPPKLDLQVFNLSKNDSVPQLLESIGQIGCFELVNHGISSDLIRSVADSGAGIFKLRPEQKATISRSNNRSYGFVEFHGHGHGHGEERETSEEFVWCRQEALKLEMEGIWPTGYSNFSEKMEMLLLEIEKVAEFIWQLVEENTKRKWRFNGDIKVDEEGSAAASICYLYKHCGGRGNIYMDEEDICTSTTTSRSCLRYDVIRMLIRGSECSHALCLHVCDGSSEFHVYSKKGWVSFCPKREAIVITIGDLLQAWSGGQYKHVIGRPIFKGKGEDCISMAFLYSPSPSSSSSIITNQNNTINISLVHQLFFLLLLTLAYNFCLYLF